MVAMAATTSQGRHLRRRQCRASAAPTTADQHNIVVVIVACMMIRVFSRTNGQARENRGLHTFSVSHCAITWRCLRRTRSVRGGAAVILTKSVRCSNFSIEVKKRIFPCPRHQSTPTCSAAPVVLSHYRPTTPLFFALFPDLVVFYSFNFFGQFPTPTCSRTTIMATTSAAAMEAVAATYLSRTTDTRLAVDAVAMAAFNEKKWVWIPDGTGGFIAAHILKEGLPNDTILVKGNDDKEYTVNINDTEKMNPPKFDKVEDMADLAYLNRPSVVHNLRLRYLSNLIYTYSGLFLVAVNPYHRLPIYSEQVVSAYKNKKRVEMPPHVYAITDQAYRDMLQDRENQSILITGESGAGKTENTKKAIQYLAYIAGEKSSHNQGMGRLEQQILQANPILESFGNAQTIRNNNSSRFGKFVRIEFNAAGAISGANIERYLLEKSRVTHQTSKERNYHIFYQLLKGGSEELKKQLLIDGSNLNAYQFIKASNKNIDGVDDGADFKSLQESMSVMGFSTEEQTDMFRSIAAILLMGNLTSVPDREGMATVTDALPYEKVCHVLGIPVEQFIKALTKPKILAGRDWVTQSKTPEQLASNVEALARATYERMFGKLVDRINSALDQPSARTTFIGVLDIAGFEIFETNGFEQLCINYTNERLQQFFNHHMFILEQEEYKREGIEWKFIDFGLDLQPTIDLIEKANPIGILSLLDEESVMPKASDKTFIDKLHGLWKGKSPKYEAMKFAGDGFLIQHYAGKVEYRTQNWLDKNRDPLNEAVTRLLANSADKFIGSLFSDYAGDADPSLAAAGGANGNAAGFAAARAAAGASGGGKSGIVKKGAFRTVAQKHKEQLVSLMSQLYSTQPHFVRCIIPNEEKKPGKLNVPLVLDQLNCNGVLEGIRICRAGFPNRLPFAEFRQRYEILCPGVIPKGFMDGRKATQTILEQLALDPNQYRLGSSKVFFKAGVLAEMEEIRDVKLGKIITGFQAQCRGFLARKQHRRRLDQYKAILHIQRNARLYIKLREWSWWKLYTKVKPLLQVGRMDEEIRRRDENISDLRSQVTRANADRDSLEATRAAIEAEKRQYEELLKSEQAAAADQAVILQRAQLRLAGLQEEVEKFNAEYADLEKSYADVSSAKVRLQVEHKDVVDQLTEERQLVERLEKERAAKEARVKQLEAEMAAGSAQLAAIEIEKKSLLQQVADYERDVMSGTEKEAELLKQKKRLEALLHDSEEKASRLESDLSTANSKRQSLESELSATKSTLGDLQKVRADLELLVKKKESELESVNAQLAAESVERESAEKSRRDLQARLAALDDQFQSEKAEKERFNKLYKKAQDEFEALQHDLENKTDQESKDQEVRRLRESELAGLKAQLVALQQEQEELKRKSAAAAAQARKEYEVLIEERDGLGKQRTAFEKKSVELESEVNEMQDAKNKMEKIKRQLDMDLSTAKARSKELEDAVTELRSTRDAIEKQLAAAAARADEGDGKNDRLEKERSTLLKQLETAREELKEEERKRSLVEAQRKKLQSDLAALQEKVDADEVAMADIQRRLQAKAQEFDVLKDQYAKDATERGAVLEEARKKLEREMADLRHKLEESEQQMASMEKLKIRLTTEVEDLRLENDRQHALTRQAERLQKQTESEVAALNAVIDNERRQREQADAKARSLQGTLDSMQMQLDEKKEAVAALQRSKGAIESEYRSLVNEIGEGGKNVHELDRMKKKLESRIEELTAQLEEEEASRGKAEEARRRLEEQFAEHRSKTEQDLLAREAQHEEARESFRREINEMGMLLEDAQAAKTQLQNAKKKLEADIADLTSKQDTTDKNKTDLEKSKKKTEQLLKDVQAKLDAADQKCKGLEEMAQRHEKKANSLSSEKEELERLLEVSERERKRFEKRSEELLAELEGGEGGSKAQLLEAKKKLDKELSRLRDELDHQQQEYLSLQSKQRDVSDTDAARGKFKEEYEEKIERLEGHTRALMAEKRLAQQEYEQTRRDIEAADRRSNMREAEIAQLKAQLDQEIAAKNEEQAQRRKLAADFKDMLNKLEMEASKSTELAESLAMFKARADQAISRYETSEMARLKAEKAEGSLRLQVKDMEETIIELGTNKKIAEDRVRALELELREVTERAEEDAAELTDAQMARRKLTHEAEEDRERHKREMDEREQQLDQFRRKYQAQLKELTAEVDLERRNSSRLKDEFKGLEADNADLASRLEEEHRAKIALLKEKERLETKAADISRQYAEALAANDDYQNQITRHIAQIREVRSQLLEVESQKSVLEKTKKSLDMRLEETTELYMQAAKDRTVAQTALASIEQEVLTLRLMAEESEERSQLAQEKLSKCELGLQQSQADVIRCKDALEDAERSKAQAEKTAKELTLRVLELEGTALGDGASRGASRLQARVDELTAALDKETRDKEEATRNARKAERTLKDLQLQLGESDKQKQRLAEEIEKLETKVKRLKQQADDLEASDSNLQLVKRRLERELQDSTERATRLEAESKRLKARGV